MTLIQALVLGVVQGLTEFLPVSSSGHLLLLPYLVDWPEQPLSFDVALHIGTLLAMAIYFHRDYWTMIRETFGDLRRHGPRLAAWGPHGRLALLIALGTVPAVIAGFVLSTVGHGLRAPEVAVVTLILGGAYMAAAERWGGRTRASGLEQLTAGRVLLIGLAQASALIPGVSRSGSTIATGMFTGLSRPVAARFSFLLAMPVTFAAAVLEVPHLRDAAAEGIGAAEILVGITASLVVGLAAIAFLLRYLATRPLYPFFYYRVALALVVAVVVL